MLIGNNVVGIIEGSDSALKNEYIVLGAHFDHISYKVINDQKVIYNGADDNASGTSAIIEIARVLVQHKNSLKRSIVIVAFDGEESGLIGSMNFIEQKTVPTSNIKLMMSIDMIGRYAASHSLIVGAMGCLEDGDEMLLRIAGRHDIVIKETGKKISERTDSKPFGQVGIPALHVTSGIIGPYHKPEDDANSIDYKGMEKISGLLFDLVVETANRESLLPIRKLTQQIKNEGLPIFRYGLKANVGSSYHAYPHKFYNGKKRFSGEVGVMTQLKITNKISLQPEVLYSTLASGNENGDFRTHSITIPVSLVFATKMDKENKNRFFINLGGYYSKHFSGSEDGKSLDFKNFYQEVETGLVYGFGMEMKSVFVCINMKYGLSNIMRDVKKYEFRSRALYFSLGYMF